MAKAGRGGHLVFFNANLPSIGAGAVVPNTPPAEQDLYDPDKEVSLHLPRSATWMTIGEECAEEGVGVSMFLAPNKFMDVGSASVVSTLTGGELFWHPKFLRERDEHIVRAQLARLVSRKQGFNCMARVRCSNGRCMQSFRLPFHLALYFELIIQFYAGLQVKSHYGCFLQMSPTELTFAHLSADNAFSVELEHSRSLSTRGYAFLQCATLYTSVDGRRRVRVMNLALNVVELAGNVFQYAELDTVLTHFAKRGLLLLFVLL